MAIIDSLVKEYNEMTLKAEKLLRILTLKPKNTENTLENKLINNAKEKLHNFITATTITKEKIHEIKQITEIFSIDTIFEMHLQQIEKEYCESEINLYQDNPEEYKLPNLEMFIENGEFLSEYILYKINNLPKNSLKEDKNLKKSL